MTHFGVAMQALVGVVLTILSAAHAKSFHFTALGDFGTGGYKWGSVTEVMSASAFHDTAEEFDTQFTISVGDNMYMPNAQQGIVDSFQETWRRKGTHGGGMWMLVGGNHDNVGPQFDYSKTDGDKWFFPSQYWTKIVDTGLGFTIQLWGLNSNGNDGNLDKLVEKSLQASTARWKFFVTHFPFRSSGRHRRVGAPVHFANLAKKYGVQAVFSGHDHILQVCADQGVAFLTTGATARGGMMDRGIDRDFTHFILTYGLQSSVGQHGIMQLFLTKNVMWGTLLRRRSVVYEFATVWDWPFKYKDYKEKVNSAVGEANQFPSAKVVLEYLRKEAAENASSTSSPTANSTAPSASNATANSTGNATAGNATASPTTAPPPTPIPTNKVNFTNESAEVIHVTDTESQGVIEKQVAKFTIAWSCQVESAHPQECDGPSFGEPFTLWIQGQPMTSRNRVFLAYDEFECERSNAGGCIAGACKPDFTDNVATITLRGDIKTYVAVYVCFSFDDGKSYTAIPDSSTGSTSINVFPARPKPAKPPLVATPTTYKRTTKGSSASSDDSTMTAIIVILIAMVVVGIPVAWKVGQRQSRRS